MIWIAQCGLNPIQCGKQTCLIVHLPSTCPGLSVEKYTTTVYLSNCFKHFSYVVCFLIYWVDMCFFKKSRQSPCLYHMNLIV